MPDREFFRQDAVTLARALVGKLLVRTFPDGRELRLRISETEAYLGVEDSACHAHKGKTSRTEVLWRDGGTIYVYLCYGMHEMLNIVSGTEGDPQAVLIRGVEGYDGPGKLTKALGIDRISGLIIRDKEAFEGWAVENHGSPYPYGDVFMI